MLYRHARCVVASLGLTCLLLLTSLLTVHVPATAEEAGAAEPAHDVRPFKAYRRRPFDVTLTYPISIFHDDHKVITGLNLNVIYGRTTSVYGLELGLVNKVIEDVRGAQIAGTINLTDRDVLGLELAGILNLSNGACIGVCIAGLANRAASAYGLQLSGGANVVKLDAHGVQISPFANAVGRHGRGLQIAMINFVRHNFDGLQISLGFNMNNGLPGGIFQGADGNAYVVPAQFWRGHNRAVQLSLANAAASLVGAQLAAVANITRSRMAGLQVAGLWNQSSGPVAGLQMAPANVAGDLVGVQVGMINVARGLTGVQLGLLNIALKNTVPFMVGINAGRSATRGGVPRPVARRRRWASLKKPHRPLS